MTKTMVAIAACATLLCAGPALAKFTPTPQQKCEQAKLKAQGALQRCLKRNSASIIGGKTDASATCQTKFTTALATADAHAAKAKVPTSCRYLDNGDGTVSDLNTGLVWEKKSPGGTGDVHDVNNIYSWSNSGSAPDGGAFTAFLGTLNGGASTDGGATTAITGCFANHCDWRLPSIVELQGIVEIDPAFGPTQSNVYWSATTFAGIPNLAWYVNFLDRSVNFDGKTSSLSYVRGVRGGF